MQGRINLPENVVSRSHNDETVTAVNVNRGKGIVTSRELSDTNQALTITIMSEEDHDSTIDEILDAPDHYTVLGVPQTVETASLRRAYLAKSVQVHPDKNNDPRATKAFQKVAEAWNVLSDEETRAQYDERGKHDDESYTPPPPPSFQDALFAFAAATSMMGSSAVGSMAETMFWAEKLVHGRPETTQTERTAHAAMALGSGLRAVAFGARMMGFKNVSVAADRSATLAQTVGVGALVTNAAKDVPAVQKALEHGGEKAKEISESINRSIKGQLERPSVQQALEKGGQLKRSIVDKLEKGG